MQGRIGAGGNNTYYIDSLEKFNKYRDYLDNKYFLSKYLDNIPVNITLVIGKYETIKLPISVQLIKQIMIDLNILEQTLFMLAN